MRNFGIKNFFKSNWKELTFIFIFSVLNIFFLNYASNLNSISIGSKKYFLILFISLFLELIASLLIFRGYKKNWNIEKIFLVLFIPIGLIYMLAIPIGRVPDEGAHLARSYGISIGHFITTANESGEYGEYIPSELASLSKENTSYDSTINKISTTEDENSFIFVDDSTMALYSFTNFIPQAIGMFIGEILHLPMIAIAYLGRLFNFACFTILFYFSIKKIPFGKTFLFFIAFLPIVLQEVTSLSADCLTIGCTTALISFTSYLAFDKTAKLTKKNYLILLILILFESLCKIVYLPLCFLIFLIPTNKFKSKKDRIIKTLLPIISVIVINLFWLLLASRYLIEYNPGVNSSEQIKNILSNPFSYLQTIFNTCISSMYQFAYGLFGGWLEWLDVEVGHIYLLISLIVATVLIYKNSATKIKIPNSSRAIIVCIAIIVIGLIFTSLYIQWNPVGSNFIGGLQGRYFLPVLLLAPAISCGLCDKIIDHSKKSNNHQLLYLFSIFQSFAAIIVIICYHIV